MTSGLRRWLSQRILLIVVAFVLVLPQGALAAQPRRVSDDTPAASAPPKVVAEETPLAAPFKVIADWGCRVRPVQRDGMKGYGC